MDDLTKGLLDAYGGGRTDGEGGLSRKSGPPAVEDEGWLSSAGLVYDVVEGSMSAVKLPRVSPKGEVGESDGRMSAALVVSLCSAVTVVEDMAVELRRGSRQRELVERDDSDVWLGE